MANSRIEHLPINAFNQWWIIIPNRTVFSVSKSQGDHFAVRCACSSVRTVSRVVYIIRFCFARNIRNNTRRKIQTNTRQIHSTLIHITSVRLCQTAARIWSTCARACYTDDVQKSVARNEHKSFALLSKAQAPNMLGLIGGVGIIVPDCG